MRVVLDTNVIISATLIRGGNEDRILRAWQRGLFDVVLSPAILEELGRALFYAKLQQYRWMTEKEISSLLHVLAQEAITVAGRVSVSASRDPDDDKFLAAAVEAHAPYVVTGDRDLLDLKNYRGIGVVTPTQFLAILRKADKGTL